VVTAISLTEANKVVEFSFEEIFKLVREDHCQLEIILLLELINCPLLVRQIAEILDRQEAEIETKIPALSSFQCVKRSYYGLEEKYEINPEVRLFTRRL
jgi:predicted transcriptional regulator